MRLSSTLLALCAATVSVSALDLSAAFQQFESQIDKATQAAASDIAAAKSAISHAQSIAKTNAAAASAEIASAQSVLAGHVTSGLSVAASKVKSAQSELGSKITSAKSDLSSVKSEVTAATKTGTDTETSKGDAAAMTVGLFGAGGLAALAGVLML